MKRISFGDLLIVGGAACFFTGLWWIHPPSAMLFCGAAIAAIGYSWD